ncbi:MAG: hypothetical protein H7Y31_02200 [Chitinophagaceae bacterium]|nr:hypothetical protein [Chitinophagaceae bacterium]
MLVIAITVNIFVLPAVAIIFATLGFIIRGNKAHSLKLKLNDLEKEMLDSHAEILQLQREKIDLLKTMDTSGIPVIPITAATDEKISEKNPDVSYRKKLMDPSVTKKQSQL